ncbi:MAG: RNA degradosome polyphosphate kinase, partial [Acidimicrobiales bacterium]
MTLEQTTPTARRPAPGEPGWTDGRVAAPEVGGAAGGTTETTGEPGPASPQGVPASPQGVIASFGYQRFANRELSRLDFGSRLLDLSEDEGVPLLERVKFMAIFSELLDELFQVRVAGLEDQVAAGVRTRSVDGLRPGEQLKVIRARVEELVARQDRIFMDGLVPAL